MDDVLNIVTATDNVVSATLRWPKIKEILVLLWDGYSLMLHPWLSSSGKPIMMFLSFRLYMGSVANRELCRADSCAFSFSTPAPRK